MSLNVHSHNGLDSVESSLYGIAFDISIIINLTPPSWHNRVMLALLSDSRTGGVGGMDMLGILPGIEGAGSGLFSLLEELGSQTMSRHRLR